jgi:hypothetical protein
MRRLLANLLAALAAATFLALSASQALANHVQCGDVITQDTTLDSDLIDCPGDGLVIGADNVTLDLNGHTIDGSAADDSAGVRSPRLVDPSLLRGVLLGSRRSPRSRGAVGARRSRRLLSLRDTARAHCQCSRHGPASTDPVSLGPPAG